MDPLDMSEVGFTDSSLKRMLKLPLETDGERLRPIDGTPRLLVTL